MPAIIAVVVIAIAVALFCIKMSNDIVRASNRCDNAWDQINAQLKRRADLIPNLVETVKGYAAHERGTLDEVISARANVMDAKTPEAKMAAENALTGTLKSLFAVAEAYPDLKANANFQQLQNQLADTEDKISYMRQSYNDTVMKYNTAIAAMMSLVNEFYAAGGCTREELRTLILLLSPVAPHICEEMWEQMGFGSGLAREPWPTYDEKAMKRTEVEIGVQVNGKVRGRIMVSPDMTREQAEKELPQRADIQQIVGGKAIAKVIFVPGRLCNLIVK